MVSQTRSQLRRTLGRVGVWSFALDGLTAKDERIAARDIEALGYPALWIPEGSASKEAFSHASGLLHATAGITVATGIANVAARSPVAMESGRRGLAEQFPGRFVLGIGIGHEYSTELHGAQWSRPFTRMRDYLDRMATAPYEGPATEPDAPLLLAALGDRMLRLAADRAAGAHTYFVPVEHTSRARELLGADPVLAVELTCVVEADPERARRIARAFAADYLELPSYANNLRRLGYSDQDVAGSGSDRLIDATIAWGEVDAVVERVRSHLDAGADHVCVQVLNDAEGPEAFLPILASLARPLLALS